MNRFSSIMNGLEKALNVLLVITLSAMVLLLAYQTVMRYVFSNAPTWSEELVTYVCCYSTMLGAALAVRHNKHLQVDFLVSRYSEKARNVMGIITSAVTIAFFVLFLKYALSLMRYATGKSVTMPFLIMKYVYFAFPLGSVLIIVFALEDLIMRIIRISGNAASERKEAGS